MDAQRARLHRDAADAARTGGQGRRSLGVDQTLPAAPGWHGTLDLRYRFEGGRSRVLDRHDGPLRVLKSLHPEGDAICHSVLVHPPGGIVGGDTLAMTIAVEPGAHAVVTTPGATRFYRSLGAPALQSLTATVAAGARLEWLPLETLAYSGCIAENRASFALEPGAAMIGWDLSALGLPASNQPFVAGRFTQSIGLPGRWLERGTLHGERPALLDSPLGWAGRRALATLWVAAGEAFDSDRREALLDVARTLAEASPLASRCGATAIDDGLVVVRLLADRVEPAMALSMAIRAAWRRTLWGLESSPPRVWRT